MARTDVVNRIKSPVKKYITFGGSDGMWSYWNGTEDVEFDTVEFALMEIRSSITGWSEANNGRISSNLVSGTRSNLSVRCKNKELYKGTYADGKAEIAAIGGNFTTNLFCYGRPVVEGAEFELLNIQLSNSCLKAWMDFLEEKGLRTIYGQKVVASRGDQQKKGAIKYYAPAFRLEDAAPEFLQAADALTNNELKPYLEQ